MSSPSARRAVRPSARLASAAKPGGQRDELTDAPTDSHRRTRACVRTVTHRSHVRYPRRRPARLERAHARRSMAWNRSHADATDKRARAGGERNMYVQNALPFGQAHTTSLFELCRFRSFGRFVVHVGTHVSTCSSFIDSIKMQTVSFV